MGSRHRRRPRSQEFTLWSPDSPTGPKFMRRISGNEGEQMVSDGVARRFDHVETGEAQGYQLLTYAQQVRNPDKLPPVPQAMSCTFTRREVEVLSGFHGESKTARLRQAWKRMGFTLDPDKVDDVETVQMKQRLYRSIH